MARKVAPPWGKVNGQEKISSRGEPEGGSSNQRGTEFVVGEADLTLEQTLAGSRGSLRGLQGHGHECHHEKKVEEASTKSLARSVKKKRTSAKHGARP